MSDADVIVVGAGLAGLTAATELHRSGRQVLVLERSDGVGGRARTDEVDGFLLDRGFQVLLTAYPTVGEVLDLGALDLQAFDPGVLVRTGSGFEAIGDPLRRPSQLPATLMSRLGTIGDQLRLLWLRGRVRRGAVDDIFDGLDETAAYRLNRLGFSSRFRQSFWAPLLAGITFEPEMVTSAHVVEFAMRMLGEGDTAVPACGMGAVAAQLAGRLPAGAVRLGAAVDRVTGSEVSVDGQSLRAARVVVATDVTTAAELVDGVEDPGWAGVTTAWFSAERPPTTARTVVLNGTGGGLVNNVAVLSNVAPTYAPVGHSLVAVSFPGTGAVDVERRLRHDLAGWWPGEDGTTTPVPDWDLLRVDEIAQARPCQLPGFDPRAPVQVGEVVVAGDHRRTASTEGAVRAGLDAAAAVLADHEP